MKKSVKTKRVLAAVLSSVFAFPAAGIFNGNQNSSSVYAEMTTNETYTCQDDEIAEEAVESDWRITKGDINGDGASTYQMPQCFHFISLVKNICMAPSLEQLM